MRNVAAWAATAAVVWAPAGFASALAQDTATEPAAPAGVAATPDATETPAEAEADRLTPAQRLEMDHLLDDVKDARLESDRRRRAALILLQREWPEATAQVRRLLVATADRSTREAIQLAIADSDRPDPTLIPPLMDQLVADDPDVRASAPAALSRFGQSEVTGSLVEIAGDVEANTDARLGAIEALGGHRTPKSLEALVDLLSDGEPEVPEAADAALRELTGRRDAKTRADWEAYADRVRAARDFNWPAAWTRNLAQAEAQLRRELAERTKRLSEAYDRLYNESDETRRPALLTDMLADDTVELRLLAVDLIERRVLNAQPVGDELRVAMRGALTDASAKVRERAALLLRDLKDAEAAERAVLLLVDEPEASVKAAFLALMARVPRAEAVGPALAALADEKLRSAAAGMLVAASEADLLNKEQSASALALTRKHLAGAEHPDPPLIRLLGRLGEPSDAKMLEAFLEHDQSTVRVAAAEQVALDRWPLDPLLDHLSDPTLRPIAIAAVARRGSTADQMQALLSNEPNVADALVAWRAAVEAVAVRLSANGVATVDEWLSDRPGSEVIHEAVLLAAGNGANGNGNAQTTAAIDARRREAQFRIADLYMRTNQPAKAKAALAKLAEREGLSETSLRRLAVAEVRLMLVQGLVDDASARTSAALDAEAKPSVDTLADAWLDAAESAAAAGRPAAAGKYVVVASELLRAEMSPDLRKRLDDLIAKLKATSPVTRNPTPPTTPPATTPTTPATPDSE